MTPRAIFVTGTGTEVGKTVVTRALTRAAVRRGLRVVALKPIESGGALHGQSCVGADALALAEAAQRDSGWGPNILYCFPDPVSPHLAARRSAVQVEEARLLEFLARSRENCDVVLAEGAGGLLVPLSDTLLQADLYSRAGYEAVVVARDALGAINATLLTLEALAHRSVKTCGVILNLSVGDHWGNREAIERHGRVPVLGALPVLEGASDDVLASAAEASLSLDALFGEKSEPLL